MMQIKKINWQRHEIWLALLAVLFFFTYSWLAINNNNIFNSPDENANYFFSKLFAEKTQLSYPINNFSDITYPRSTTLVNGNIVPQSFLGLPVVYGFLAKIFSIKIIIFLTPLFTVIASWFFYQLIKKVFNNQVALISFILFLSHPAVLYYTNRSMFHNMLFVNFLMVGFYFLCAVNEHTPPTPPARGGNDPRVSLVVSTLSNFSLFSTNNPSPTNDSYKKNLMNVSPPRRGGWGGAHVYLTTTLSALFLSLALITRTSEVPWILLILIILYFYNRKNFNYKQILISLVILIIIVSPILFLNNKLYGSPFSTGYQPTSLSQTTITNNQTTLTKTRLLKNIVKNSWNYEISFFWWLSLPAFLGLIYLLKNYKNLDKKQQQYLILFIIGAIFLTLYYGTWMFHDNPDPKRITIGTSYVRYWLPIYIFSLPLIAVFLIRAWKTTKAKPPIWRLSLVFVTSALITYNLIFTFYTTKDESLLQINNNLKLYSKIKQEILQITEPDSIIIANYYDKLFFPERVVIKNIDEEREKRLKEIAKLINNGYNLYYYSWQPDVDINYLNNKFLNKYKIEIIDGVSIFREERLFKVLTKN